MAGNGLHKTVFSAVAVTRYKRVELSAPDESDITIVETRLEEEFSGALAGTGRATHLRLEKSDGTSTLLCYERFSGQLDGLSGSFILRATGYTDDRQVVHGNWEVVQDTGTRELRGLRGYAAFGAYRDQKSQSGWSANTALTYWFD